jgi:hypothetical protein
MHRQGRNKQLCCGFEFTGLMNIVELVIQLVYKNEWLKLYGADLAKY